MNKTTLILLFSVFISNNTFASKNVDFAKFDEVSLISELKNNSSKDTGASIKAISSLFLGIPYYVGRLIGSNVEKEKLVVDLGKLDCFTYLDYVESFRRSKVINEFFENLIQIRYFDGDIDYLSRKHFFSDWVSGNKPNVNDVTSQVSTVTVSVTKSLNQKSDGETYIPGLAVKQRSITYIPSNAVDNSVLSLLQDGDYIGIYTNIDGLDVTHTGIFIRGSNGPVLRHASSSSKNKKVMDSKFMEYIKSKPGILVYRSSRS
ncbi:DUF1460 domain-containing protein [Photobacterium chitinilyticum]|uniref:DUF1460 domain-containing protein n=1 Tax=Photobacterium chitinilyticum TaxID=2485123 RepID=UPI003D15187A